jgi:hypothetical protein
MQSSTFPGGGCCKEYHDYRDECCRTNFANTSKNPSDRSNPEQFPCLQSSHPFSSAIKPVLPNISNESKPHNCLKTTFSDNVSHGLRISGMNRRPLSAPVPYNFTSLLDTANQVENKKEKCSCLKLTSFLGKDSASQKEFYQPLCKFCLDKHRRVVTPFTVADTHSPNYKALEAKKSIISPPAVNNNMSSTFFKRPVSYPFNENYRTSELRLKTYSVLRPTSSLNTTFSPSAHVKTLKHYISDTVSAPNVYDHGGNAHDNFIPYSSGDNFRSITELPSGNVREPEAGGSPSSSNDQFPSNLKKLGDFHGKPQELSQGIRFKNQVNTLLRGSSPCTKLPLDEEYSVKSFISGEDNKTEEAITSDNSFDDIGNSRNSFIYKIGGEIAPMLDMVRDGNVITEAFQLFGWERRKRGRPSKAGNRMACSEFHSKSHEPSKSSSVDLYIKDYKRCLHTC